MNESYHILLIDDQEEDLDLIKLELSKLDMPVMVHTCMTQKAGKEYLIHHTPDLIISDYNLPDGNGLELLRYVQDLHPDLPFILISGQIDNKKAVEIMLSGATDYVLKDDLVRLVPAILRDLKQHELNLKLEKLINETNELTKTGQWEIDLVNNTLFWSEEVKRIHEVLPSYTPTLEEALTFYSDASFKKQLRSAIEKTIEADIPYELEGRIRTAKGNEKWLKSAGKAEFKKGKAIRVYGSVQDITKRKLAEIKLQKSEHKLREIIEHTTNLFYRHDVNGHFTYLSPQASYFLGVTPDEALANWQDFVTDHPSNQVGQAYTRKAIETGEVQPTYEFQLKRIDGKKLWVQVNEAPIIENGEVVAITGSLTDITHLKAIQEKQEMLSMVASETENMVFITDADDCIVWVNDAFLRKTGYKNIEVLGKRPPDFLLGPNPNPEEVIDLRRKIMAGQRVTQEMINYTKDGQKYWVQSSVTPIFDETGKIKQFFSIQEDITERKAFIQKLKEQTLRLQDSQKVGNIGDWYFLVKEEKIFWSDNMYHIYDRDPEKGPPSYAELLSYYPEDSELYVKRIREAIQENQPYSFDLKLRTESGIDKYVHAEGIPSADEQGKVYKIHGTLLDITKRKKAELELIRREQELTSLTNNVQAIFQTYKLFKDGSTKYLYISAAAEKLHEIPTETILQTPDCLREQVLKEDLESLKASIEESARKLTIWDHVYRIRVPSGKVKWIHGIGTPRKTEDGFIWDIVKIDVTHQRVLQQEQEDLYRIIENNLAEIYIIDAEKYRFRYVNKIAICSLGYSREQFMQMTLFDIKDELSRTHLDAMIAKINNGQSLAVDYEVLHKRADGSLYPVQAFLTKDSFKGEPVYVISAIDVSEKKLTEKNNEVLLAEVHHRVKNNLALISGLLWLELNDLPETDQTMSLQRSINRIHSIAKVHELLYKTSNWSTIDISHYLEELTEVIKGSLQTGNNIEFRYSVDNIELNVNEAIPLGMLFNELITNSLKYAFNGQNGTITVNIHKEDDQYLIHYNDNGKGFDKDFELEKAETIGMKLLQNFLNQLTTHYELETCNGMDLKFYFKGNGKEKGSASNRVIHAR